MAFRPHRFGRYIIIDPIAVGGMAEIYRARLAGSKEGPDRVIVIKKVIANLSQNSEFIQMFEEEIKITVGLTNPNIIQIYDYGKVEDQYFMAMEYVEGKNLRQFVKRLADMKSMFSIDMSAHIISQICHALAYAHAYKDRMSGTPLCIVHRDISPQNIMISYDGAIKLFDFGIAKAKSASEATRAGVIKGKPSYLSPEQINGEELDGRSDIFALGIVLWELLTAKRLFVADTDMGVLRLIQSAKIEPPSTFNPSVPQALDGIVLKGLQRDRNKRYQNAEEFQRDLHKFLYSFNPSFNPADLSYYAQELFKLEIKEDKERLHKFLSMEPDEAESSSGAPPTPDKKKELSNKMAEGLVSTNDFNREMMEIANKDGPMNSADAPSLDLQVTKGTWKPPSPFQNKQGSTGFIQKPNGTSITGKRTSTDNMVIPPWSKAGTSGSKMIPRPGTNSGSLKTSVEKPSNTKFNVAILLFVFMLGGGFALYKFGYIGKKAVEEDQVAANEKPVSDKGSDRKPTSNPDNPAKPAGPVKQDPPVTRTASPNTATIVLQTDAKDFQVIVNGETVVLNNNQFNAPFKSDLKIEVQRTGYETIRFKTNIDLQNSPAAFKLDWKKVTSGVLSLITTPPSAKLTIFHDNEKILEAASPLENKALPVGRYKVLIENDIIGYKSEIEVVIEDGKVTSVDKYLK